MVKSHIKNANNLTVDDVKNLADQASKYVVEWTAGHTRKLLNREIIIIPVGTGYLIGRYAIKSIGQVWVVYNYWGELISEFTSKKTATVWCLLYQTGRLIQSQQVLNQDRKLSKLTQDHAHYQYARQKAINNKNHFAIDLYNARISSIQSALEVARYDLQKTLNSTKYLKGIWEKPL